MYRVIYTSMKRHAHWSTCCTAHDLETSLRLSDVFLIGQQQHTTRLHSLKQPHVPCNRKLGYVGWPIFTQPISRNEHIRGTPSQPPDLSQLGHKWVSSPDTFWESTMRVLGRVSDFRYRFSIAAEPMSACPG